LIRKNQDGSVTIEQSSNVFPLGTVEGTAIGAFVGLLGEMPVTGAARGAMVGSLADSNRAGVNMEFLEEVSGKLKPGKWAVVSDISEEVSTSVDQQMKALGGHVFRVPWQNVEDKQDAREVTLLQTNIEKLEKEEKAEARAEKRAEIHSKAEDLRDKLHNRLEQAKLRSEERRKEFEAKLKYLEGKMANTRGNVKTAMEARVKDLRKKAEPTQKVQVQTT